MTAAYELTVACPRCKAIVGQECFYVLKRQIVFRYVSHYERAKLAVAASAPGPSVPREPEVCIPGVDAGTTGRLTTTSSSLATPARGDDVPRPHAVDDGSSTLFSDTGAVKGGTYGEVRAVQHRGIHY